MSVNFLALAALVHAGMSLACNAWNEGLPTATGTVSSSAVIEIAAGATFDGGWKKVRCLFYTLYAFSPI